MGPDNVPPVGGPGPSSDDDFDPTVETPSVGGEPTRLIPAVAPQGPSGPGEPPGPYGPTGDDGRRRLLLIVAAVVLAAIVAAVIIVLATRSNNSNSASDTTSTSDSTSSTSSTSSSTSTSVPDTTTTSTAAPTTTAATASTAVQITSFQATSARPSCTVPNPEASSSVPANPQQVTFRWTTVFAATVDISVDGPGVYRSNIGAANSITIPYGCPGPHTYLLTAHGGDGTTTTRTLTVTSTH